MAVFCNRQYEIIIRNPLRTTQFFALRGEYMVKWLLKEGQPGALAMELPVRRCNIGEFLVSDFNEDFLIEIRRSVNGIRTLVGEAPFLLELISSRQAENGERLIYIEGTCALGILERRIVPYDGDDVRANLAPLACDDQMKFVVRNNMLAIAGSYITDPDPVRDLSTYFTVQPDTTQVTAQYEGQVQNQTVLSIINRIQQFAFSRQEPLFYHVIQTADFGNPFLEFRTFTTQRGVDRTLTTGGVNARGITPDNGTISQYELIYNWKDTASRMYGGGRGIGAARSYVLSDDPTLPARLARSPFALREMFANAGSIDALDVQVETDLQLQANLASIQLNGSLGETPVFVYGQDWLWGDRVTAFVDGINIDVYIDTEECSLQDGSEQLSVGFSNNLGRRLTGLSEIFQRVSGAERKIDYINSLDYA